MASSSTRTAQRAPSVARRPFVVNVADVRRSGRDQRALREGALTATTSGASVLAGTIVTADVVLQPAGGNAIEVVGTVRAPWVGECRRCLGTVVGELEAVVDHELFVEDPDELSYLLSDDEIDLEPLARDAVLLELPLAPLCREDCLGLCATCGADLNEGECGCRPPRDPRWAALDQLRDSEGT